MIQRELEPVVRRLTQWFPIVSVTGPRQSGKSTLVRTTFPDYEYINLENVDTLAAAQRDPVAFIRERPRKLIIDEAQLVPELFNMLQVVSDEENVAGQYVLSGSQNFLLLKRITQSLAGRVGILRLLPFSVRELHTTDNSWSIDELILRGGYPRLYDAKIPLQLYFDSYLSTYLERDVAGYLDVRNVRSYESTIRLLAQVTGNLLNLTRLANDVGVSTKTVRQWLSMLESSYIVFELPPYFANIRKRLIKTPKIYFYDTGLLCHLLGIRTLEQLRTSKYRGAIFENFVIAETVKRHYNAGRTPEMYFYRDTTGKEVDLIDLTDGAEIVEIKAGMTFKSEFSKLVQEVHGLLNLPNCYCCIVMQREDEITVDGVKVVPVRQWVMREDVPIA